MKENSKSTQDTDLTIRWQRILNLRKILTQQSNEREFLKCAKDWRNNPMKENSKSAQDSNVTIQ